MARSGKAGIQQVMRYKKQKRLAAVKRIKRSVPADKQIHRFKRSAGGVVINGNASWAPWKGYIDFKLSYLPNNTDFSNLFDEYMITYVVVKFWLKIDPSAQTAATASYPKIYYARDNNDVTTPASLDELREHSDCKVIVMNPNRPVVIKLKPNVLAEAFRGAGTTTYTPKWRQWLPLTAADVTHYGIKMCIDDLTNTNYKVESEVTYWLSCKKAQ